MSSQSSHHQHPGDQSWPASQARHVSVLRIVRQLTNESDPDTLMRCLVDEAVALLRGQVGSVACWNEEEQVLKRVWSTIPLVDGRPYDIRPGEGLGGQSIVLRRPVISNDYDNDPLALGVAKRVGLKSGIAAPLLREGELLGAIMIGTRDPEVRFTEEDGESLEILASVAASVVAGLRPARLSWALLAARTAQHHLNNQLGVTVGYADMLANDPRLPADLRAYAAEILTSAMDAAETVDRLRRLTRLEEADAGAPDGQQVINMARSVGEDGAPVPPARSSWI
jgi:signal transduction protein with GAF and PtsI domain